MTFLQISLLSLFLYTALFFSIENDSPLQFELSPTANMSL